MSSSNYSARRLGVRIGFRPLRCIWAVSKFNRTLPSATLASTSTRTCPCVVSSMWSSTVALVRCDNFGASASIHVVLPCSTPGVGDVTGSQPLRLQKLSTCWRVATQLRRLYSPFITTAPALSTVCGDLIM
jgi:hypothetical protein